MDRSGGILRKKSNYQLNQNFDDLLVIGYASKIFRDDAKANVIDQQRHLIPWRDTDLKIDRYDVRGHCEDLTQFEAQAGGYGTRSDYLTPAEQRAETLCEEERYYSLLKNEVEEEMYREEQFKRLANSYNEIGFSYEGYGEIGPEPAKPPEPPPEDTDNAPFALPPLLEIPPEIELPANMKEHAIIEKTAKFIASQGLQMEILMKAKQANNAQFDFLNIGGKCNAYYKHILGLIKNNTYVSFDQEESKTDEASNDSSLDTRKEEETAAIIVPQIRYKPSADCAYTQLISKITGATITSIEAASQSPQNGNSSADTGTKLPNGLLGLVSYNSDSETDHESEPEEDKFIGEMPPDFLQTIIDKTALYVAKNGTEFEEILRIKQDPRFTFLDLENEYHPYYMNKVRLSRIEIGSEIVEKIQKKPEVVKKVLEAPKTKVILPVSFSIKPKDDNQVPLKPTILPQEPSSDEEETTASAKQTPAEISTMNNDSYIEELERQIESINDFNQKKEAKKNEEKIKDKLANAAREKLNMVSKEKLLQIERRKKAMAFLSTIKGVSPSTTNGNGKPEEQPQVIDLGDDKIVTIVDDSDDSVHSIPIPDDRSKSHSKSRKRSSSRDSRSSSRRKKTKSSHSKKKSKRRSRTRSRSRSSDRKYHKSLKSRRDSRDRSREHSRDSRDRRDRRH